MQNFLKRTHDSQKSRNQGRNQILSGSSADDCVVSARHSRPVIGCNHQTHFDKLASIDGQTTLKPQQRNDSTNAQILL